MKRYLFFLIVICSISFSVEPCRYRKNVVSCEFVAKYNGAYCGGARPQEGMLDELAKPKILKNTTIKIFASGKKKPSFKIKTDADGKCVLKLPEGEWNYTLTSSIDKSILYVNKKCSKAINKVYGTFSVKKSTAATIELFYHFECDPCDPNIKKRQ